MFIISGCQKKKISDVEIIDLTKGLTNNSETVKLSSVAKEIQYIFLETNEKCMIDKIAKIMLDDSLVFIFNRKQFFVFNEDGKFLREVGNVGRGPGEYLRIMDFTINPVDDRIYIYDSDQRKVICYRYNGIFEFEFKTDSYPTCIANMNNKFLILSWVRPDFIENDNYTFSIYTLDGKLVRKTFDRKDENAKLSEPSTLMTRLNYYSDSLTYWEVHKDNIYRINPEGIPIPRYRINYKTNNSSKNRNGASQNIYRFGQFIETKKYLFFMQGIYNNTLKNIIYDKVNGYCYSIQFKHKDKSLMLRTGFVNDIDGGYPFLPYDALKDGRLYCTFLPYELKALTSQDIYDKVEIQNTAQQQRLYNRINTAQMVDNPVIMLLKMY